METKGIAPAIAEKTQLERAPRRDRVSQYV